MRLILLLLIALPFCAGAQINRSAKELASETTKAYLTDKIFKGKIYSPVSYGEIKPVNDPRSEISWTLDHKFKIEETDTGWGKEEHLQKSYHFRFYLDSRMKVIRAESYSVDNIQLLL
jgi:hypothetical protein